MKLIDMIFTSKRCSNCNEIKHRDEFYKNKKAKDGLDYRCRKCSSRRYYNSLKNKDGMYEDKRIEGKWGYGKDSIDVLLRNKRYLKDRTELFKKHGNGWWWVASEKTHPQQPDRRKV